MFLFTLLLNCEKKKIVYNICTVAPLYQFKAYICTVLLKHHLFQVCLNLLFRFLCTQIKVVHQLCQPTYQWGTVDTPINFLGSIPFIFFKRDTCVKNRLYTDLNQY